MPCFSKECIDESYVLETASTLILGEDPTEEFSSDEKPIRLLTDFCIFDADSLEEVTLDDLPKEENSTNTERYEAVGHVAPIYEEEEAGQDDDCQDDYAPEIAKTPSEPQKLRTSRVLNFSIDYTDADSPVYLQTAYAWYMLGKPMKTTHTSYAKDYMASYKPHRLAQLLIAQARDYPDKMLSNFKDLFIGSYDYAMSSRITEKDVDNSAPVVCAAVADPSYLEVSRSPLIKELLDSRGLRVRSQSRAPPRQAPPVRTRSYANNIDLEVLRPEKQHRTYVTSLIDALSRGLFREKLKVGGKPKRLPTPNKVQKHFLRTRLLNFMKAAANPDKRLTFDAADRKHGEYWNAFTIHGTKYEVGDVVLVPAGIYPGRKAPEIIPDKVDEQKVREDHTLAHYFWFGKLIWINQRNRQGHVRWMEHASTTFLDEVHDPQELFLVDLCNDIDLTIVAGKVPVRYWGNLSQEERVRQRLNLNYRAFFYSFTYNQKLATFCTVDQSESSFVDPRDNCALCLQMHERDEQDYGRCLKDRAGTIVGVAYRGERYHINDYAIIKTTSTLALVGQILEIKLHRNSSVLVMGLLGRVCDILELFPEELNDERHFFLSDWTMPVELQDITGPCKVVNANGLSPSQLEEWLAQSPKHLFVRYHFPELDPKERGSRRVLAGRHAKLFKTCKLCQEEDVQMRKLRKSYHERHVDEWQLRTFDPFGGVGPFALSMQETGCIRLTHAVEISPSASRTLQNNSPDTIVYNQCANVVLEYAVKFAKYTEDPAGQFAPEPPDALGDRSRLPDPPGPKDIDCIVAGFPCQPHSHLNMYQKAHDRKSNLILNLLSWVDFLKPKYCFFENVRGFLNFNLNAVQVDQYRVTGGIEKGGLKFVVRAMIAMGYQVRFGLLQAAHYGTPQTRVRFFLIAAKLGLVLPEFPQPLYYFEPKDALQITFPHSLRVYPINTQPGIALFNYVTIEDAISDLPRFDWYNPRRSERPRRDPETQKEIPIIDCSRYKVYCGPTAVPYHHEPRNNEEEDAGESLQHFTRVLRDIVVARVVHIPLRPKADYRELFRHEFHDLWEWQTSDPKSATARHGYRPGMYGRPDMTKWFQTTVTNVEPTAKQSWVLNPYCKRVVTVRELARSQGFPDHFKFYCITSDTVKTMHRQIGNAVPWPVGVALGRELRDAMFKQWFDHGRGEADELIE
ncbi:hypothetical protein NM688_g4121 [Phlebia brevispora]|uniref:Uncharacterized protein n=1 Tax=Phlebia brevispora TaxID=194682 RepID=A0ACC1T3S4_9APHY|nr:hypothetical protein NM688_g4121 [Phlebia brevispora]